MTFRYNSVALVNAEDAHQYEGAQTNAWVAQVTGRFTTIFSNEVLPEHQLARNIILGALDDVENFDGTLGTTYRAAYGTLLAGSRDQINDATQMLERIIAWGIQRQGEAFDKFMFAYSLVPENGNASGLQNFWLVMAINQVEAALQEAPGDDEESEVAAHTVNPVDANALDAQEAEVADKLRNINQQIRGINAILQMVDPRFQELKPRFGHLVIPADGSLPEGLSEDDIGDYFEYFDLWQNEQASAQERAALTTQSTSLEEERKALVDQRLAQLSHSQGVAEAEDDAYGSNEEVRLIAKAMATYRDRSGALNIDTINFSALANHLLPIIARDDTSSEGVRNKLQNDAQLVENIIKFDILMLDE